MSSGNLSSNLSGDNSGELSGNNFASFFETWLTRQTTDLNALLAAASSPPPPPAGDLRRLLSSVLQNYELYYKTKQSSAHLNILPMFSPHWTSSTENLLLWCGGWRPSLLFHLLYSQCGLQTQSHLQDLIFGSKTQDLADVDAAQLQQIDALHRKSLKLEREIAEEEAAAQGKVAGGEMVELCHEMTVKEEGMERMEEEMKGERELMEEVLRKADFLRMETLREVVGVLRPMQGVHFLIVVAEMHLRVHEFGRRKDVEGATAVEHSESSNGYSRKA